jgi:SagB-type dehydrogenase family enzyme
MGVGAAIEARRSSRTFDRNFAVDLKAISTILYLSCGTRKQIGSLALKRNTPNSGNLGSIEIYVVALSIQDVEPGIYHYDSVDCALTQLNTGNFRLWIREFVCYQSEFSDCSALLILTSNVGRLKAKYGERGYRLGLLDAGHVSQNIQLVCTSIGLAVCATAGFIDDEVNRTLRLDGLRDATVLCLAVGGPTS